ncbi:MAG: hypothetical protein XD66_0227 [Thermacetogenium phaeum]|uniref:Uncharacterized protein n=1 Tax=Thermacetogenium phaeum TaxID=85874 RepID=A0A101FHF3_9THEO|nr:MAG: hypothetical protein XD66_0227 [Thermacetogenium phaeum]
MLRNRYLTYPKILAAGYPRPGITVRNRTPQRVFKSNRRN